LKLRQLENEKEATKRPWCSDQVDNNEDVSIVLFQRVMIRLLKYLDYDLSVLDIQAYDDGDQRVSWQSFAECWKDLKLETTLSSLERIFITFASDASCVLGKLVSAVVMLCIIVSSTSFILSTLQGPLWQYQPCEKCKPMPRPIFGQIELACLVIFTAEFLLKLLTCHAIRIQLLNADLLVETLCSDEQAKRFGRLDRIMAFWKEPSNVIDFLAIAPYYFELLIGSQTNLMVLRLVRLTRMFRILRLGKFNDAMEALTETFRVSAAPLSVLGFYISLGILVTSSLVYFAEVGTWDPEQDAYFVENSLNNEKQESAFVSIPECFWWNIVSVTTVGYGDLYPVTKLGKTFGSATIIVGVIAFAMPVGVISSNFSRVWDHAQDEKQKSAHHGLTVAEGEARTIARGFDHKGLAYSIVKFEVFDDDGYGSEPGFLGEAIVDLARMGWTADAPSQNTVTLRLEKNLEKSKKNVSGTLQINLLWDPTGSNSDPAASKEQLAPMSSKLSKCERYPEVANAQVGKKDCTLPVVIKEFWERPETPELVGRLTVQVVSAKDLARLHSRFVGFSDPFCQVTVFPALSPQSEVWPTSIMEHTVNPVWNETKNFDLDWRSKPLSPAMLANKLVAELEKELEFWREKVNVQLSSKGSTRVSVDAQAAGLRPPQREEPRPESMLTQSEWTAGAGNQNLPFEMPQEDQGQLEPLEQEA
jgi:hypothetical protein